MRTQLLGMYTKDNLSLQKYKLINHIATVRIYSGFTLLTDYGGSSFIDELH